MRYTLNRFVNTDVSLYTSMICLQRDFKEENGEVMVAHNYFIEYYQMEQTNIAEQIIPLLNNILSIISAINDDLGFKDVEYSRYDKQKLKILSIEELSNKYPTLSLKDALNHYVAANGLTFIRKVYKPLPNGKRLLSGQPTTDNYEESGILYVYNDTTNSVIPIVKIAIRPNQELIKKQIIMDIPVVLQEQIYSNTILNEQLKFPLSLGVQIFFSNLMFINLKKFHLCEVVHSPCSPKLMKYFKDNEIEIM
jgi:asparagine synthetase A